MKIKKFEQFKESVKQAGELKMMKDWFHKRTNTHIKAVQKNWRKLYDSQFNKHLEELDDKEKHIYQHDASKFQDPEFTPYIYITWSYKMRDEGKEYTMPEGMDVKANEATTFHVLNNQHHPEHWAGEDSDIINKGDRDAPVRDKVIDGTKMPNWAICEMLCDWAAVSQERKSSLMEWADMNVGEDKRWKFTDEQTKLIYDLVYYFEGK